MKKKEAQEPALSRRDFVRTTGFSTGAWVAVGGGAIVAATAQSVAKQAIIAALGDTLIPTDPGDPGYKTLESHGISEEVLKALPGVRDENLQVFNDAPTGLFPGKTFLELSEGQRAEYLKAIIEGKFATPEPGRTLQRVYRNTRRRVFTLFYSNFPEHEWPRDRAGLPILKPGDAHQITNPNTRELVTGWDIAGFHGPMTWETEERRRNRMKAIHWHENWSPFDYQPEDLKKKG